MKLFDHLRDIAGLCSNESQLRKVGPEAGNAFIDVAVVL